MAGAGAALAADGGWMELFDGKSLNGWTAAENPGTWKVSNGLLMNDGPRSHLFHSETFKNFEAEVEVFAKPYCNSGLFFHTKYQEKNFPVKGFEIQVNNSHTDWRRTGGLYAVADNKEHVADDGKWFTETIIVKDKKVTIFVDGKKTSEWDQPADWKGIKDFPERTLTSGTVALQAHDPNSIVAYKNIRIKQLK